MPRKAKPRTAASATAPTSKASPASAPARDVRPYIYLAFNQLFAVGYVYVIIAVIPSRLPSASANLWALPILMQLVALGAATVLLRSPRAQRIGWWTVVVGSSLLVLATLVVIVRVLISAAFLSGVYGAFGKAAAMSALIGVALVVELVGLLPLFQIKFMRTRAGRRAYSMGS